MRIRRKNVFLVCASFLTFVAALAALCCGRYGISPAVLWRAFFEPSLVSDPMIETVLWQVRMPRVAMALLAGASLAVAGTALQAMFTNPLVSEHILGVSSGAGFGAALGILFFGDTLSIQISAVFFGIVAMSAACFVARRDGRIRTLTLVLAGVVVSSLFMSGTSLLQYVADSEKELPAIVFWLMGGLSRTTVHTVSRAAPILLVSVYLLYHYRWQLNLLSLSEEESLSLGVDVKRLRLTIVFLTTLITAAVVSSCGTIAFVGLVVPHFARMIVGPDNTHLLPSAALLGALFILSVDTAARTLTASEIPLSILTSFVGAPFFAYLLRRVGGGWND